MRVSRQSNSGTYDFLREHVLKNKDFKNGSRDMNGSKEVVELVASTPTRHRLQRHGLCHAGRQDAQGCSKKKGEPADRAQRREHAGQDLPDRPLAPCLHARRRPQGAVKAYIDWMMSDAGQKIVESTGYVPLPAEARTK